MGDGADEPRPTFCIVVDGRLVGWVDYDRDERSWLTHDEVNIGYGLHPDARGKGYATRAVQLMMHHLALATDVRTGSLFINRDNQWSLGVAARAGFGEPIELDGNPLFKRPVPRVTYTDGTVTIRAPRDADAATMVDATDEEQIRWLFEPDHRPLWAAKSPSEKLEHQRSYLRGVVESWGTGPKWSFTIEVDEEYAGHVDCDLANPHVPPGEANISYSCPPTHRGKGYVSASVRLILSFVGEHTGAREAHIVVDPGNEASLRVSAAVGATESGRYVDHHGQTMVRHVIRLRS